MTKTIVPKNVGFKFMLKKTSHEHEREHERMLSDSLF